MIEFFVPGIPKPGGSKRAFYVKKLNRAVITDAGGASTKEWRQQVAAFARDAYNGPLLDGAMTVTMQFFMPRPKGHSGSKGIKPSAPLYPATKPDVLKLARSTEDALTGIIWRDDCTTVSLSLDKQYADSRPDGRPGARITVERSPIQTYGELITP